MRLDVDRLTEYAARFEITVNTTGLVVVHFYDKHGGLFDVVEAESFKVEEKPRRCDCESSSCHPNADCQNQALVRTTHSRICVACAAKMPAKYLQAA
jgi:hypothetical protein